MNPISRKSFIFADSDILQDELKANDMVQMIKERLEQYRVDSSTNKVDSGVSELGSAYGGKQIDSKLVPGESTTKILPGFGSFRPSPATGDWESVSHASGSSSAYRVLDGDIWQPVDQDRRTVAFPWAPPEALPARRATFDESDLMRYRRRPAWKCKHCEGVGWSEDAPCEGCGRYLPENVNFQAPPRPRPPAREGDWLCVCCGNTNWEWRTQCNRCHTCRDVPTQADPTDADGGAAAPMDDLVKQRLKKRLSTHPAGVFKDNDWVCVSCGNINWDWRTKCHQCSTGKPVATAAVAAPSTTVRYTS